MSESVTSKRDPPKTSGPPTATVTAKQDDQLPPQQPETPLLYVLQDYFISFVLLLLAGLQYLVQCLVRLLEVLYASLVRLYRFLCFCYEKPELAKEIFTTTLHLLKVSYDAGLWSWADAYETVTQQLGKATKENLPNPPPVLQHKK